ncbi:hypothetical protein LXT21_29205 [Myxococcus sp. K38C18041901]|uniref:hypothetical protein n=1 Tax=Myxococcus guangdongensis TaxID=2906760 RepID=UPI0020A7FBB0|nr:hypothetical protein [Myxococcus guangdongensis]MCP3062870.1 hypothetical protein [Myxococcus guangdongensis]
MKTRYRLMLAAAVVLVVAVGVGLMGQGTPPASRSVEQAELVPVPIPSSPEARAVEGAGPERVVPGGEATPPATVVALGPGDVAPEPEVANPPPQQNDEIVPEQPQTAQWKLEKTKHITAVLGRDVERLERERELAESRGDLERVRQTEILIQRHRGRLVSLGEEIQALSKEAAAEATRQ